MAAGHADLALVIAIRPRLRFLDKLLGSPSALGKLCSKPFALGYKRIFESWHCGSPLRRLRRLRPYRTSRPTAVPACSRIGTSGTGSTPARIVPLLRQGSAYKARRGDDLVSVAAVDVPGAQGSARPRRHLSLRPLPRAWLWYLVSVVSMIDRRLPIRPPIADQPFIEGQQHLALGCPESRICPYCVNDAGHSPRVVRWSVAQQSSKCVGFQLQQAFEPSERSGLWYGSPLFPLPHRTWCESEDTSDSPLRESGGLSRCSQGMAESFAPVGTTHDGWFRSGSLHHKPGGCRTASHLSRRCYTPACRKRDTPASI